MKQFLPPLALAALTIWLGGCDKSAPSPPNSPAVAATNAPAPAAKANPDLEKLKGKWERPDGGYVLEIRGIDADGRVDAAYLNPSPIHVARGLAYREAGMTKLFVELRDVNYPGCTYTLEFDAKNDQLFGQYFQATMNQTYDIVFARMK